MDDQSCLEATPAAEAMQRNATGCNTFASNALPKLPGESAARWSPTDDRIALASSTEGDFAGLDVRKRAALSALVCGRTFTAAASQVGVDRSTLLRWRREPAFARLLSRMSAEAMEASTTRARNLVLKSQRVLGEALSGGDRFAWAMRIANSRRLWEMGNVMPADDADAATS